MQWHSCSPVMSLERACSEASMVDGLPTIPNVTFLLKVVVLRSSQYSDNCGTGWPCDLHVTVT